ncbi:MAG: hypothetical protein K8T26_08350 [Lentisphaerae bacterium]|nr:hypothetical protein [Lentisphaerota bacterium]
MKNTFLIIIALGLAIVAASAGEDSRLMHVYPLYTAEAAAVVSMVESVLGPAAKVIYDKPNGRLLILATAEEHKQVADVLTQVNVAPMNIRIEVTTDESEQQELSSFGVSGDGTVTVDDSGTSVSGTVRPRASQRSGRRGRAVKQTLLLQSGGEAVLHVGEEVPYADWIMQYGVNQGYLPQVVTMREVGALLHVQARVIGDGPLMTLKLTPELTGVSDTGAQSITFTRLSTDITVQDGQTLDIGGLTSNVEFYEKFLMGLDRGGNRRALTIKVTPHIEAPAKPAS